MGVLRFITMSYKTKSEQSECKIHDPMIYACGCGKRDIPFFIPTPLGMIGIPTLKFLSAPFKKWNLKGSFFSQHLWQICQLLWRNNLNPLFKNLSSLEVLLIKLIWNIPKLRASSWSSVIVFIIIINIFHVITEPKGWHGSVLHVVYQYTERTKMRSDNRQYRYSI